MLHRHTSAASDVDDLLASLADSQACVLPLTPRSVLPTTPRSPRSRTPTQKRSVGVSSAIVAVANESQCGYARSQCGYASDDSACTDVDAIPPLPEPLLALPPDIVIRLFMISAGFNMNCKPDLKELAFGLRNATYNPRERCGVLTLRLFQPRLTAKVCASGHVDLKTGGWSSFEDVREGARKIARMAQHCGCSEAVVMGFRIHSASYKTRLPFPIRLEDVARKWRHHALYEPEATSSLVFKLLKPSCSMNVWVTGNVTIHCVDPSEAQDALRQTYPIFLDCSR